MTLFIQDVTQDHLLFEPLLVNYEEASLDIGILLVLSPVETGQFVAFCKGVRLNERFP